MPFSRLRLASGDVQLNWDQIWFSQSELNLPVELGVSQSFSFLLLFIPV